ncbi:substrate-binding domain-containing protein [Motilimonas cestriensis]|uniref:Substrate-binding domain-containing protein n=1 Tax=Motilimonas cestriensis TaxID=2742685 RepID=A0ABS8W316_9GAMM|nr:substrate-binding domain-containing protein [Motilimonas cestriensis]
MGYQPNFFARTLSTPAQKQRSNLVAILVSDFSNPFQSYLFEVLSNTLQQHAKQPMLVNVKHEQDLDQAIMRLSGYQVDGVVAVAGSLAVEGFEQCLRLSLPLVTLGRADERGIISSVQTDNYQAGRLAAEHLLSLGLSKLGFVAGRNDGSASNERLLGFQHLITERLGEQALVLYANSYGYSAGFELAVRAIEAIRNLEGLFCASDALAMGVMDSCRNVSGIRVPEQLRIVGCDDVPQAAWQGYQLTTIAQPVGEIADTVMLKLNQIWQNQELAPTLTRLSPKLKVRRT